MSTALRLSQFPAAVGLGSLVLATLAVEAAIRGNLVNRFIVPPPSAVLAAVPRVIQEEDIAGRLLQTGGEAVVAIALIMVVGIGLGILLYQVRLLRQATEDWIAAMAAAPTVLMYPLFLVIFGRSAMTIIMMGFVAGLPPIVLKTIEGLVSIRRVLVDVGRSFKLSPFQQFRLILLPAALPTIFVGLRLSLIVALINIVGVEFLINFGGLGHLINDLAERYDLPAMYASILFVVLLSVAVFAATEKAERWLRAR